MRNILGIVQNIVNNLISNSLLKILVCSHHEIFRVLYRCVGHSIILFFSMFTDGPAPLLYYCIGYPCTTGVAVYPALFCIRAATILT